MDRLEHIEKIVSSETLHGSDTLCNLLRYLVEHSTEDNPRGVKEYQIATEALGRSSDFDPRIDSTVRVAVARLRTKLDEYYTHQGIHDPVRIEIPKGSYRALFHDRRRRKGGAAETGNGHASVSRPESEASFGYSMPWRTRTLIAVAGAAVAFVAALLGWTARSHRAPGASASVTITQTAAALTQFWAGFVATPENPVVVYSNAQFVGRAHSTGLRYFDPATDSAGDIVDTYTGVGEVVAVHALGRLFWRLGRDIDVKRSGLLAWDAAKNASLIFVGGPFENVSVRELRKLREESEFVFEPVKDPSRDYGSMLVNRRPAAGEQAAYNATRGTQGQRDYALIQMAGGFAPGRRILILAGISTQGTEGAVDFVCRANKVEELLAKLEIGPEDPVEAFECVLEIDISGGVPLDSRIVAVRNRAQSLPGAGNARE
jgi:hypothetical protein